MKLRIIFAFSLLLITQLSFSQEKKWVNPIIKNYGRILELEKVDVAPDPNMEYKILIELVHKLDKPENAAFAATNVARLINLHGVGGVKPENLKVAVVIHAGATSSVLNADAYKTKYEVESPYAPLYKELMEAGVEVIVCGQSYSMYGNKVEDLMPGVKIGTSALTTISTYQLKGYAFFKWE
ncbi:DsrE family protein [Roseivirga seohaensis]|uniref:DsrE family protein n=1 Tax=Roseivirga seohaensis TaxID=1914963 RepID=UPI0008F692A0|nr:DsrE family protein [Roseivirga seohaensis]